MSKSTTKEGSDNDSQVGSLPPNIDGFFRKYYKITKTLKAAGKVRVDLVESIFEHQLYIVKRIEFSADQNGREVREAKAMAMLPHHPNVVQYRMAWIEMMEKEGHRTCSAVEPLQRNSHSQSVHHNSGPPPLGFLQEVPEEPPFAASETSPPETTKRRKGSRASIDSGTGRSSKSAETTLVSVNYVDEAASPEATSWGLREVVIPTQAAATLDGEAASAGGEPGTGICSPILEIHQEDGEIQSHYLDSKCARTLHILMSFVDGMELGEWLRIERGKGQISCSLFYKMAKELASALDHLHRAKIIHRDLHPGNIVIERGTHKPVVIDLGSFTRMKRDGTAKKGRKVRLSSDVKNQWEEPCSRQSDIFRLGQKFKRLLSCCEPFEEQEATTKLINEMLSQKPQERPTLQRAIAHFAEKFSKTAEVADLRDMVVALTAQKEELDQRLDEKTKYAKEMELKLEKLEKKYSEICQMNLKGVEKH